MMRFDKSGSVQDVLLAAIFLFGFAIAFLITHNVMTRTVEEMLTTTTINESEPTVKALGGITETLTRLDALIFAVLVAFILGIIITGFLVGGHPIFMFIYFIVIILSVVISTVLANTWETATATAQLTSSLTAFPITNFIMLKLPIFVTIIGFIGIVVMFGKPYVFGGEQ